jgi:predicted ATP-dependent endonuclease of OLD family
MAALQALAEVEAERAPGEEHRKRGLLLAVEEPELYQHPAQARHIARTFASLTDRTGQVQIIACTHSPIFVDIRSFESVRVVRKRSEALTETASATLGATATALDAAYGGRGRYTADGVRPGLRGLLNPYISEVFFSDFVVLVEGEEDKAILEAALARHAARDLVGRRAFVVTPVGGKKNLDKLVLILEQLRIPSYLVFDRDGEGREREESVTRTNLALQRLVGVRQPEPMPATRAENTWSVFAPCLTDVVKDEIGPENWLTYRDRACDAWGIEARKNIEKNPEIVSRMLEMAEADGRSSPSIINCIDAIVRRFRTTYPDEQVEIPATAR